MIKLSEKLRIFKARKKLQYDEIALYCGVSVQAIKNICHDERCPKKLRVTLANKLVQFTDNFITLKDCGRK